jgi:membrane fusion protein (multidrug efflux system)
MLVDKEEIARQIYDTALAAARASEAAVAAERANVEAAEQAVEQARSDLASAQASHRTAQTAPRQIAASRARALAAQAVVKQKRAALEQAQLNLLYTKITAPVTGQVTKTVVVGMNVEPGQQLLTIVPLEEVWITANFKETQLRYIRPGQRVEFYVDSNGRTYRGRVDSVAAATGPLYSLFPPENATGNYVKIVQRVPVKIILEPGQNRDLQLRPGVNVVPKVYLR